MSRPGTTAAAAAAAATLAAAADGHEHSDHAHHHDHHHPHSHSLVPAASSDGVSDAYSRAALAHARPLRHDSDAVAARIPPRDSAGTTVPDDEEYDVVEDDHHSHNHRDHGNHASGTSRFRRVLDRLRQPAHARAATSRERRIVFVAVLTLAFFLLEIIVGYTANSIALIADSFHMLGKRTDRKPNFTFGYQRAEVLGAFANSMFLLALCLTIGIDAIQRYVGPEEISNPMLVMVVGILGLAMNITSLFLFHEHGGHSHSGGGGHSHAHSPAAPKNHNRTASFHASAQARADIIAKADMLRSTVRDEPGAVAVSSQPTCSRKSDEKDHHHTSDGDGHDHSHSDGHGHGHGGAARHTDAHSHDHGHAHAAGDDNNGGGSGHLNMRGLFLHVAGDAMGSLGVIVSALVFWFAQGQWRLYVDPTVSLLICGLIVWSTVPLVKSAAFILLQGVPASVQIDRLRQEIRMLPGILDVHEFHVWGLSDFKSVASVHILVSEPTSYHGGAKPHDKLLDPPAPPPYMEIASSVKRLLHSYGVHSTTVQPEFVRPRALAHPVANASAGVEVTGTRRRKPAACAPSACAAAAAAAAETRPHHHHHHHHQDRLHEHGPLASLDAAAPSVEPFSSRTANGDVVFVVPADLPSAADAAPCRNCASGTSDAASISSSSSSSSSSDEAASSSAAGGGRAANSAPPAVPGAATDGDADYHHDHHHGHLDAGDSGHSDGHFTDGDSGTAEGECLLSCIEPSCKDQLCCPPLPAAAAAAAADDAPPPGFARRLQARLPDALRRGLLHLPHHQQQQQQQAPPSATENDDWAVAVDVPPG
ncbi:hypothetical protein HK405_009363, partial [Cladochytrium tenue]